MKLWLSGRCCNWAGWLSLLADSYNNRIQKFSPDGKFETKWGGFLGTGLKGDSSGSFNVVTAIEVDALGQVFVADFYNHRIQAFTDEGDFLVKFGSQVSVPGVFERPTEMTVDSKGNIYVVDFGNNRIQKFAPLISQTKNEWKLISSTKWIWKPNFNSYLPPLWTCLRGNCASGYLNPEAPLQVMQQRFYSKTPGDCCVFCSYGSVRCSGELNL